MDNEQAVRTRHYSVVETHLTAFQDQVEEHIQMVSDRAGLKLWIQPFIIINNRIVLLREICAKYGWRRPGERALTEKELGTRFKYIIRDLLFIGMMATLEYHTIKILAGLSDHPASEYIKKKDERKVHLSQLIKWIGDESLWRFAIALRNDIVHFDAYARQTMESPDIEFPITMTQGEQASGVLRSSLSLSRELERSFYGFVIDLKQPS